MIPNSHLVKCKSHDKDTENNVQIILRRAIFAAFGLYPMNNHTNATLRDIECKKYNSETLSEIKYKLMDAGSVIKSHLVHIIKMSHASRINRSNT